MGGRGVFCRGVGSGQALSSSSLALLGWFFTREQLENTPSRRCGVEADKELSYRQQAANLIQEMGQRLNVYPFLFLAFPAHALSLSLLAGSPGLVPREHGAVASAFAGPRPRRKGRQVRVRKVARDRRRSGGGGETGNAGREAALCNLFGAARGGGGGWECRPDERGLLGIIAGKRRLLPLLVREGLES